MEKYFDGKYKVDFKRLSLINREGYELFTIRDRETDKLNGGFLSEDVRFILDKALQEFFKNGYCRVVQGPGTWIELDPESGENNGSVLSPDGYEHSFCIPPEYYDQLDDEIKAKLK